MRLITSHASERDPAGGMVTAELLIHGSCRVRAFPRWTRTEAVKDALTWAAIQRVTVENRAEMEASIVPSSPAKPAHTFEELAAAARWQMDNLHLGMDSSQGVDAATVADVLFTWLAEYATAEQKVRLAARVRESLGL